MLLCRQKQANLFLPFHLTARTPTRPSLESNISTRKYAEILARGHWRMTRALSSTWRRWSTVPLRNPTYVPSARPFLFFSFRRPTLAPSAFHNVTLESSSTWRRRRSTSIAGPSTPEDANSSFLAFATENHLHRNHRGTHSDGTLNLFPRSPHFVKRRSSYFHIFALSTAENRLHVGLSHFDGEHRRRGRKGTRFYAARAKLAGRPVACVSVIVRGCFPTDTRWRKARERPLPAARRGTSNADRR